MKLHQSSLVDAMTAICINAPELLLWKVVSGYGDIIQHQVSVVPAAITANNYLDNGQGVLRFVSTYRYLPCISRSHGKWKWKCKSNRTAVVQINRTEPLQIDPNLSEPLQIDPIASLRRQSEIFGSTPSTSTSTQRHTDPLLETELLQRSRPPCPSYVRS